MEAMWMLSGREDSAFLDNYIQDFGARFAIDGIVPDAYGYRWRYALGFDQLNEIIRQFVQNPNTRQAVLQMWGAGRTDLLAETIRPCNLTATFRIRNKKLNMTVFNRSNDLIWGCCGANAVHFPILQEYLATRIGVNIGEYWQVTTNLHLYTDHYQKLISKLGEEQPEEDAIEEDKYSPYGQTLQLVSNPDCFDDELYEVMDFIEKMHQGNLEIYDGNISNAFLREVVLRMAMAHYLYKNGKMIDALDIVDTVTADDWKTAGREWLERRKK
jgi:hypothetical protein